MRSPTLCRQMGTMSKRGQEPEEVDTGGLLHKFGYNAEIIPASISSEYMGILNLHVHLTQVVYMFVHRQTLLNATR